MRRERAFYRSQGIGFQGTIAPLGVERRVTGLLRQDLTRDHLFATHQPSDFIGTTRAIWLARAFGISSDRPQANSGAKHWSRQCPHGPEVATSRGWVRRLVLLRESCVAFRAPTPGSFAGLRDGLPGSGGSFTTRSSFPRACGACTGLRGSGPWHVVQFTLPAQSGNH